jgi:hypothetical protein
VSCPLKLSIWAGNLNTHTRKWRISVSSIYQLLQGFLLLRPYFLTAISVLRIRHSVALQQLHFLLILSPVRDGSLLLILRHCWQRPVSHTDGYVIISSFKCGAAHRNCLSLLTREHRLAPCDSTSGISSAITGSLYEQIKTYRRQIQSLSCSRNSTLFLRNINIKPVRVWYAAYNTGYFTLSHLLQKCCPRIPRDIRQGSQGIRGYISLKLTYYKATVFS